jgi:signal transduction histidine kinase
METPARGRPRPAAWVLSGDYYPKMMFQPHAVISARRLSAGRAECLTIDPLPGTCVVLARLPNGRRWHADQYGVTSDDQKAFGTGSRPTRRGLLRRDAADLARTLGFLGLYVVAAYVGRRTALAGTDLSLVWPAAGVGVLWLLVQRRSRWWLLDVAVLAVASFAINHATGISAWLAVVLAAANAAQSCTFAYLFRRWLPGLWGGGGGPLSRLVELRRFIAIAAISATCGAAIGSAGVWMITGDYAVPTTAGLLARNGAGMLLIGAAGLRVGCCLHRHSWRVADKPWLALRRAAAGMPALRRLEYVAVVAASATVYVVAFGIDHGLPLAFPVVITTIWAGLRLRTTFVVLHDLTFGALAVVFTLHGVGPFAQIESALSRAVVVQAFIVIVAVVGLAVALSRDERTTLLAQLRSTTAAVARQAQLLSTVVDSMSEGLVVVDADGRLLLTNRAAEDLLGGPSSDLRSGRPIDASVYGLYGTDGVLLAHHELPHRQALATGARRGMDLVVRNDGVPAGRTLAVVATPLPIDFNGGRCAVTVFSDVTAERRHRDELASFAGVVAHDLLNPLTTIEGWSEEVADVPGAAAGIARVQRAAARMRTLINDLLGHATARDGLLAPADVSLADTLTEITVARLDHADSTGKPAPRLNIDELPRVHADPALVRQLLNNLVDNAIKYTAAGVTPEITVSSAAADEGYVRIDVADNGIGIPAGQHEAVFDNFHRAHRNTSYAGTGLGLAICRRIVERHGGIITAGPNPVEGGTVFSFTLPLARQPVAARPSAPATIRPESTGRALSAAIAA